MRNAKTNRLQAKYGIKAVVNAAVQIQARDNYIYKEDIKAWARNSLLNDCFYFHKAGLSYCKVGNTYVLCRVLPKATLNKEFKHHICILERLK